MHARRTTCRLARLGLVMALGGMVGCVGDARQFEDACAAGDAECSAGQGAEPVTGTAIVDTPLGEREVAYEVRDGYAVAEGDILLGPAEEVGFVDKGSGRASRDYRWPFRTVPYVINTALPAVMQTRATDAIAHWESNTEMDFVPRTTEADYVEFINGNECSSFVGRAGNRQVVNLSTGKPSGLIVGIAIAKSDDMVYTWYSDGMASGGSSSVLDKDRPQYPFSLPPGYVVAQIVAMGIDTDDRVTTWYTDGRYTIGSTSNLDKYLAPTQYTLPPGYSTSHIVGMDIASTNRVYVWYSDGRRSIGTSADLDTHGAPAAYATAPGKVPADIIDLGISSSDRTYAWYTTQYSAGSTTNLASALSLRSYATPGDCSTGSIIHELGHAAGLWHEQSRCDRDSYVIFNPANVQSGKAGQFDKQCDGARDLAGYDVGSIMHYGSFFFSIDNMSPTLTLLDGTTFNAQRAALSANDLQSVRELYGYSPAVGQT
jgi:hypothetical protein